MSPAAAALNAFKHTHEHTHTPTIVSCRYCKHRFAVLYMVKLSESKSDMNERGLVETAREIRAEKEKQETRKCAVLSSCVGWQAASSFLQMISTLMLASDNS